MTCRSSGQAAERPSAGSEAISRQGGQFLGLHVRLSPPVSTSHSPWPVLGPAECAATVVFVHSFSRVQLFVTPWTAAHQASLSFTISQSLLRLMSLKLVMSSNHLILCHPLLLLPSLLPSIRVFSNELALCIKYKIKVFICVNNSDHMWWGKGSYSSLTAQEPPVDIHPRKNQSL